MSAEKTIDTDKVATTINTPTFSAKLSSRQSWSNMTLPLFFKRELGLLMRNRSDSLQPFIFFVIVVFLFPLSVKPEPELLQIMLPGCIWVSVVLATMMGLDNVFRDDFSDGSLEQFIISSRSLALIVIAKILAHWLVTGGFTQFSGSANQPSYRHPEPTRGDFIHLAHARHTQSTISRSCRRGLDSQFTT